MLSVSPISINQKNRQSTPSFKGVYTLTGSGTNTAAIELAQKIVEKKLVSQVKLFYKGSDYLQVECSDSLNKSIRTIIGRLAKKHGITIQKIKSTKIDI